MEAGAFFMVSYINSKKLTIRYSLYQAAFYLTNAGIFAFAATYLLDKDFQTSQVGIILALSNLFSCILQPCLGTFADRLKKFVLSQMIAFFLMISFICFMVIQICHVPLVVFGFLYVTGGLLVSVTMCLNNALCVYYSNKNYPINYGIGLGIGSLSYSFASLGLGYVIAWLGADWMVWIVMISLAAQIIIVLGYPKISDQKYTISEKDNRVPAKETVSMRIFFKQYKFFIIAITGIILIAACHSMAENYLISVFQNIGGNSKNVGVALFLACLSAAPFQLLFEKIQKKISILTLMRLSGIFYMAKAILLILATQIWHVYAIELLQMITYGFIYPSLFYFAKQKIAKTDIAKGQALVIAAFTLGTALGSLIGGKLIDVFHLKTMLLAAFAFAGIGSLIIHFNVDK